MSDLKQVKVDNWGIYFLQRLKHFFNRTDYCDLTLQFQDNAQLKVHRLVLSACTEYFELLERTCEMYEDCLVMPDDLQADVVVPIVNFMYTGQLEFKIELLDKLHQTSQIMNMPVLSKLLDAQRQQAAPKPPPAHSYSGIKHYAKSGSSKSKTPMPSTSSSKRTFSKAFEFVNTRDKHMNKSASTSSANNGRYNSPSPGPPEISLPRKIARGEPRPTRYELPEELDNDNIYENSFSDISYTSTPLMVHPETTKRFTPKRGQYSTPTSTKRFSHGPSTVEIVECRKVSKEVNVYEDDPMLDETDMFGGDILSHTQAPVKNTNQLFDQILDSQQNNTGPKVTIEAKNSKQASKLDHAKIISEVLKKYPHLVKSNKNIKLKLLDTGSTAPAKPVKRRPATPQILPKEEIKLKTEPDFTYESEVLDSVKAAKLIALGAENVKGPWICLICGTPGRALHFTSYYKFRRHLVEVHNEKPVSNMCEYCGLKSLKRNYLLHHLYTKHGKKPPPQYHFPKCNLCSYIALNEGYLVKHKMTHAETRNFRCNVCAAAFNSSSMLLMHIQNTGHKYSAERRTNLQCVYCLKVFLRESNLYAHLKTNHKQEAKTDCIIDDSDEDKPQEEEEKEHKPIKYEVPIAFEQEPESEDDSTYQIQQKLPNIDIMERPKRHRTLQTSPRQKILNSGFSAPIQSPVQTPQKKTKIPSIQNQFLKHESMTLPNTNQDDIIVIGETEYIMRDNQLIPKNTKLADNDQFILSDMMHGDVDPLHSLASDGSLEFSSLHAHAQEMNEPEMKLTKKPMNQPIQIVVSNEEEYKALMSSNHSIIFDDPETNKRLTVLSAPHNSSMDGTAIDLDNTQSNEMMIIQDDFPLNVSETVSADNSNIVVVYSHPVGENKPYQLITSQALGGAQFVSTSAVLTRNYETVTTSAAVVNTHIIDNHGNWHNNLEQAIEHQQEQVTQEPELQVLSNVEEVVMASSENEITDKMEEELPEVHLLPQREKVVNSQESEMEQHTLIEHSNDIENENRTLDNTVVDQMDNVDNVSSMSVVDNVPLQAIEDAEALAIESEVPINETLQEENNEVSGQTLLQEQESSECNVSEDKLDGPSNLEETVVEQESIPNEPEPLEEVCDSQEPPVQPEEEMVSDQPESSADSTFVPVTKEQIQNLASEWSDDDEIPQSEPPVHEHVDTTVTEIDNAENNSIELEESIENIQQEMEKQMTRIVAIEPIEECVSPNPEDVQTIQEIQQDAAVSNIVPACPEKISSLLNDWDENDSQEEANENDPQESNENEEEATEPTATSEQAVAEDVAVEENTSAGDTEIPAEDKGVPKKDDKIKSLVSDWDDDDDEDGAKE